MYVKGVLIMGRKALEINSLHEYKTEALTNLKNTTDSKYTRLVLTIIMIIKIIFLVSFYQSIRPI